MFQMPIDRERREPERANGPEQLAYGSRAVALDGEQCNEDADRDRDDVRLEGRGADFESFDRG